METSWQQVEKGVWPMNQLQTPRNLCLPLPAASPKQNRELVAVLSCNYCFRMLLPHKFVMSASRLRLRVRVCVCACARVCVCVCACVRVTTGAFRAWYKMFLKWQRFFVFVCFVSLEKEKERKIMQNRKHSDWTTCSYSDQSLPLLASYT